MNWRAVWRSIFFRYSYISLQDAFDRSSSFDRSSWSPSLRPRAGGSMTNPRPDESMVWRRPELSSVDRSTALVDPLASIDSADFRRWKSRVNELGDNELGDDRPDRAEPADRFDRFERSMSDDGERRPSDPLWDRSKPTGSGATAAMFMADTFRRIVCWRKASLKWPKLPRLRERRFSRLAPWRFSS